VRATPAEINREKKRREALKRRDWDPIAALEGNPQQIPIFLDKTRDRVVTGTRQGGKTRFALTDVIEAHRLNNDRGESAYVDMDKEHGGKVAWDELGLILDKFRVPARIIDEELIFDNGSKLYIFSGEPTQLKKLQGLKYVRLIVDECQELQKLSELLTLVKPALMRHNGRVILMGIPGKVSGMGDWWDYTEGKNSKLFAQHRITFWDNPYLSQEAKVELFESEKERLGEFHPDFLRHWKGVWPMTNNALRMFHYDPDKHGYDEGEAPDCQLHALGLDPGGVLDREAIVVLGHGNKDGVAWHLDEDETEKKEGGDWDDSGDRVGPMQDKWECNIRFYDWGSAHKDALTLIYKKDRQILMTGVPSKDPYEESKRINQALKAGKLKIKRGSKLEKALLYTEWDKESLMNGGKPKQSKKYKQNLGDALRCAMWAVYGFVPPAKAGRRQLTDVEQEALRIANKEAYKYANGQSKRQDKYSPPQVSHTFSKPATPRNPPQTNRNGRVNRGY
jgi:hypothetical protein